jgi:DNA-3-methyladenine glycosylase II
MTAAVMLRPETSFNIEPLGPFSLRAAARFWGDFAAAAHSGLNDEDHLHMAFPVEGDWTTVGVCVREVHGAIVGEVYGTADTDTVRRQTACILSLDVDGRGLPEIAVRDPVAGALLARFPGLRPVCFYSPYEAATWAIISQRISMRQAAGIKSRLAGAFGNSVSIHGQAMQAFPPPSALRELESFPGLVGPKVANLRSVAHAALAGDLSAQYLRSLADDEALSQLRKLPGIGPFSAQLVLLRGAGHPDFLTLEEPKFRRAVGGAYGFDHQPTDRDLERISEAWRPYRTWITFLMRQQSA